MEKVMDREQITLLNELTQGRELTNMLRKHLHPSSSPETRLVLLEKILCSYEKALSMLSWSGSTVESKPSFSTLGSPASVAYSSPGSDASDKKNVFKKRKTCSGWSEQIRVCSGVSLEGPLDDGYCWRKYGQKDILGSKFPRGYYRCTHRFSQGCLAAKQIQRSDEDPTIFEVKYRGRHTCNQASHLVATSVSRATESMEKRKQPRGMFLSFETGFEVKTDELDNRRDMFPSFSFPMENDMMVPSFVSPATSDANYFSLPTFHMGSFGLGQNVHISESELTEIISAPTSVTNLPIVDLDISLLEKLEFDPSFPFDNPDFFY